MPLHPDITEYLIKNIAQYPATNGHAYLTEREKEVLQLLGKGLSNKAVSEALKIGEGTVKVHVSHILGKLNLTSRTEAALWAVQTGLAE
jgi:DNA-binding NarL/FixJ family response regulator